MKRSTPILLFMALWWIIPFFFIDLLNYRRNNFMPQFLYPVTIAISIACSIAFSIRETKHFTRILLFMTFWWIIPFFFIDLLRYPLIPYFSSHRLHFLTIAITIICAIIVGIVDWKNKLWAKCAFWGRYLIVIGVYAAQMIFTLYVVSWLSSERRYTIEYFDSCPGGSFAMLFFPSIIIYAVIGGILGLVVQIVKFVRTMPSSRGQFGLRSITDAPSYMTLPENLGFSCSECEQYITASRSYRGTVIRCPLCGERTLVPEETQPRKQ